MRIGEGNVEGLRRRIQGGGVSRAELERLLGDARAGVQALARQQLRRLNLEAEEAVRLREMLTHERRLWARGLTRVAGVDEVGVGPLAGPVVAAACVLPPGTSLPGVRDSKQLSCKARELLGALIRERAVECALGFCSVEEIDRLNILQASLLAMRRAVVALSAPVEHVLVDGRSLLGVTLPQTRLVGGDRASQSIAAGSIVAKLHRDALMERMAEVYPGYGFERHRGYPTRAHVEALQRLGPSPIHRSTFRPVAEAARKASARACSDRSA